jgi:hypothetical protein
VGAFGDLRAGTPVSKRTDRSKASSRRGVPYDINGKLSNGFAIPFSQSFHLLVDRGVEVLFPALCADSSRHVLNDFQIISPPEIHARGLLNDLSLTEGA